MADTKRNSDGSKVKRDQIIREETDRSPSWSCRPSSLLLFSDIRSLDGSLFRGADLLTGGFPCQPVSVAGKRRGKEDDRWLWPEMLRVIKEARPRWVLAENVPGIIGMGLDDCLSDLETEGYETGTLIIPACAVNAPHRRDRVWIVANPEEQYSNGGNDNGAGRSSQVSKFRDGYQAGRTGSSWWDSEPDVGRVAHGIPRRVDRLRSLGNAIVPQVAYQIIKELR